MVFLEPVYYVVVREFYGFIHQSSYCHTVGGFVDLLWSFDGVFSEVAYRGKVFALVFADFLRIQHAWRGLPVNASDDECDEQQHGCCY